MNDLVATRALNVLDDQLEVEARAPVENTSSVNVDTGYAVLVDGEIDEKIVGLAESLGAEFAIGRDKSGTANSSSVSILTDDKIKKVKASNT